MAEHGVLTFTSATILEILYGLFCKGATAQIHRALTVFGQNDEVVPTPDDYRFAAEIAASVTKNGRPIGLLDPLIAACAINHGCILATGNTAHFRFIQQAGYALAIDNWRARDEI